MFWGPQRIALIIIPSWTKARHVHILDRDDSAKWIFLCKWHAVFPPQYSVVHYSGYLSKFFYITTTPCFENNLKHNLTWIRSVRVQVTTKLHDLEIIQICKGSTISHSCYWYFARRDTLWRWHISQLKTLPVFLNRYTWM